jgi:hypothetical protein
MKKYIVVLGLIAFAAVLRLVPHPANITPICASALFGAAYLNRKWLMFLAPFLALFLSDLVLNNVVYAQYYTGFQWFTSPLMYIALAALVTVGMYRLRQISPKNILIASLIGSLVFFLISNLWSWQWDAMYTKDLSGLMTCYMNGLPFLLRSALGDLFYASVFFGAYELMSNSKWLSASKQPNQDAPHQA